MKAFFSLQVFKLESSPHPFLFAVETTLVEQAQQQMQLKENQHIQNKIAEHFGNPIGAISN